MFFLGSLLELNDNGCYLWLTIELQVPLLTSMGEEERALVKAIESGDTDLVYFSIFHNWRQVSGIVVSFNDLEQLLAFYVLTCRYPVQGT